MQDRFIEVTVDDGTQITVNVAHITVVGFDVVNGKSKTFVSTSARQVFYVKEDYEYVSNIVRRAHL